MTCVVLPLELFRPSEEILGQKLVPPKQQRRSPSTSHRPCATYHVALSLASRPPRPQTSTCSSTSTTATSTIFRCFCFLHFSPTSLKRSAATGGPHLQRLAPAAAAHHRRRPRRRLSIFPIDPCHVALFGHNNFHSANTDSTPRRLLAPQGRAPVDRLAGPADARRPRRRRHRRGHRSCAIPACLRNGQEPRWH